jgi:hypothetical protein
MIMMKKKTYFLLIPFTIIFIELVACDFILIGTGFYDIYDVISKVFSIYPVRSLVVSLTFYFFRLTYCIFYIGILLFVLNKILLKLKNLIIIFISIFLTLFFAIVLVSSWPARYLGNEYFFNYSVFGKLFWELQMPCWNFIRLIYSIFYAVFLLLVFNIRILKFPLKIIFSVILLATITNLFWIIEILVRGWRGLYWLTYIHTALFITGIMFLFWLVFINKNNNANNYKIDITFYGVLYTLFLLIFIVLFKILFKNVYDHDGLDYSFSKYWMHYSFIIFLQITIIFAFNILVIRHEKIIINTKIICFNIFSMIIIPIYTFMSSYIVLNPIITEMLEIPYWGFRGGSYFDPINWIKLGNIIFGFVTYECLFITYIKQIKQDAKYGHFA